MCVEIKIKQTVLCETIILAHTSNLAILQVS